MKKFHLVMVWLALVLSLVSIILSGLLVYDLSKQPEPVVGAVVEEAAAEPTLRELQDGKPFRYVSGNNQHPIVRIMMLGFLEACDDYEVDCEINGIDFVDVTAIIAKSEEAISLGSSGIVYYPEEVFYETQKKIKDAGIPLVGFHVPVDDSHKDILDGWVAANGPDYAQRSAVAMAEKIGCKGPVALTLGSHNDVETPVANAFTEKIKELCPGIVVLPPEEEGFEPSASIAKAAAILSANPDITAAFSTTGAGSTTWATAARDAGKQPGEITIISMDYSEQNLDWVRDGWVYALVGQPLYEETYRCVELLIEMLKGNEIEYANWYPAPLIFAADVDKYYAYGDRVVDRWK